MPQQNVSVGIPVFNGEKFFKKALTSIIFSKPQKLRNNYFK